MTRRTPLLPWIALATVYLVWGSTYLGIRVAVATIPPYLMTGVRYAVAGALLFGLQWSFARSKLARPARAELGRIAVVATLLLVVGNGLLCLAETRIESGTAALLIATMPIFMVLLDAIRARRSPGTLAVCGILIGALGIAALVGKFPTRADALMAGVILFSSFSWAAGSVYARGTVHRPLTAPLEMLIGGALATVVGLAIGEAAHVRIAAISGPSLGGMLWLIVGGAMIGYSAYAFVLRTLPASTVATTGYVNPVVAVILGAAFLHEPVTWNVLAGGAAVVCSVALILIGTRRAAEDVTSYG